MTISYVVHNVSILLNIILLRINHVPYNCSSSNSFKDCPVFSFQFILPLLFIPNTKEEAYDGLRNKIFLVRTPSLMTPFFLASALISLILGGIASASVSSIVLPDNSTKPSLVLLHFAVIIALDRLTFLLRYKLSSSSLYSSSLDLMSGTKILYPNTPRIILEYST